MAEIFSAQGQLFRLATEAVTFTAQRDARGRWSGRLFIRRQGESWDTAYQTWCDYLTTEELVDQVASELATNL